MSGRFLRTIAMLDRPSGLMRPGVLVRVLRPRRSGAATSPSEPSLTRSYSG